MFTIVVPAKSEERNEEIKEMVECDYTYQQKKIE